MKDKLGICILIAMLLVWVSFTFIIPLWVTASGEIVSIIKGISNAC